MGILGGIKNTAKAYQNKVDEFAYFFREASGQKEAQIKAFARQINEINRKNYPDKRNLVIKTKPGLDRSYFEIEGKTPRWIHEVRPGKYELSKELI